MDVSGALGTGKVEKAREMQACGLWATPVGVSSESFQGFERREEICQEII